MLDTTGSRIAAHRSDSRRGPRAGRLVLAMFALLAGAICFAGRAIAADNTALHLANVDGSKNSYVRIPNSAAFALQQFTIETWVQRTGTGYGFSTDPVGGAIVGMPAEGTVGSFLGSWYVNWSNSGQAFFSVAHNVGGNGVELQSAAVATPLGRHHIAGVVAADSVRLYIDGVYATGARWTLGSVYVGANDMLIGADNFGAGYLRRFDGAIDDVRIWDHARSAKQITTFMNCRLSGTEPGLVAYYRFDAADLADATGHGHTGTPVATATALTFTPLATLSACVTDVGSGVGAAIATLTVSPQPTRGPARVRFAVPRAGRVTVAVFDIAGRNCLTLADRWYEPGEYELQGDLARASTGHPVAGVRFVRLASEGRVVARTVVIVP